MDPVGATRTRPALSASLRVLHCCQPGIPPCCHPALHPVTCQPPREQREKGRLPRYKNLERGVVLLLWNLCRHSLPWWQGKDRSQPRTAAHLPSTLQSHLFDLHIWAEKRHHSISSQQIVLVHLQGRKAFSLSLLPALTPIPVLCQEMRKAMLNLWLVILFCLIAALFVRNGSLRI